MKYVVKQVDDPSTDRIYYGVYVDQDLGYLYYKAEDLILLLDREEHANIICYILNLEDNSEEKGDE